MTTLDLSRYGITFLLAVCAWLLLCIAIWGVPKNSKRQAEELAEQAEALRQRTRAALIEREDAFVAEMEVRLPMQRAYIVLLGQREKTLDNIRKKALAHGLLMDAEKEVFRIKSDRERIATHCARAANAYNNIAVLSGGDYLSQQANMNQRGRM